MGCSSGPFGHQPLGDPQQKKKTPLRMGWYVKVRERKLVGVGVGSMISRLAAHLGTSWPHPIMVVFSPLVGERNHRGQGQWVINNYSTSACWI